MTAAIVAVAFLALYIVLVVRCAPDTREGAGSLPAERDRRGNVWW